jgi:hypothetical protein
MRTVVVTVLALIGGFLAGMVLSEIIGVVGLLVFEELVGFKFLPVVTALVAAGVAAVVDLRARRRSASSTPPRGRANDDAGRRPTRP